MKLFHWIVGAALASAVAAVTTAATAADVYPSKPIRFVVGFPAGSSIDVVSRVVLDDIRARTGAIIVVENRPGALGAIGIENVQRSAPDGYTLMPSSSATHSSGPSLSVAVGKLDPVGSLARVARIARFDIAVVTRSAGQYKSAKALEEAARARPDQLTFGYGSGTGQLSSAAFSKAANIKVRAVPYKGQPAAVTDLIGGYIDFVSSDLGAVMPFVRQGVLTPIAVLAERRSKLLPDAPTATEAGLPAVTLSGWLGIDAPIGVPAQVVRWWEEQSRLSLADKGVQDRMLAAGMEAWPLAGEPLAKFVRDEQARWSAHAREAGVRPE